MRLCCLLLFSLASLGLADPYTPGAACPTATLADYLASVGACTFHGGSYSNFRVGGSLYNAAILVTPTIRLGTGFSASYGQFSGFTLTGLDGSAFYDSSQNPGKQTFVLDYSLDVGKFDVVRNIDFGGLSNSYSGFDLATRITASFTQVDLYFGRPDRFVVVPATYYADYYPSQNDGEFHYLHQSRVGSSVADLVADHPPGMSPVNYQFETTITTYPQATPFSISRLDQLELIPNQAEIVATPEPSTYALFGLGLAVLFLCRQWKTPRSSSAAGLLATLLVGVLSLKADPFVSGGACPTATLSDYENSPGVCFVGQNEFGGFLRSPGNTFDLTQVLVTPLYTGSSRPQTATNVYAGFRFTGLDGGDLYNSTMGPGKLLFSYALWTGAYQRILEPVYRITTAGAHGEEEYLAGITIDLSYANGFHYSAPYGDESGARPDGEAPVTNLTAHVDEQLIYQYPGEYPLSYRNYNSLLVQPKGVSFRVASLVEAFAIDPETGRLPASESRPINLTPTPEPASYALLGAGLFALILKRRTW